MSCGKDIRSDAVRLEIQEQLRDLADEFLPEGTKLTLVAHMPNASILIVSQHDSIDEVLDDVEAVKREKEARH